MYGETFYWSILEYAGLFGVYWDSPYSVYVLARNIVQTIIHGVLTILITSDFYLKSLRTIQWI